MPTVMLQREGILGPERARTARPQEPGSCSSVPLLGFKTLCTSTSQNTCKKPPFSLTFMDENISAHFSYCHIASLTGKGHGTDPAHAPAPGTEQRGEFLQLVETLGHHAEAGCWLYIATSRRRRQWEKLWEKHECRGRLPQLRSWHEGHTPQQKQPADSTGDQFQPSHPAAMRH